jgi:polyphosphate glucokinase
MATRASHDSRSSERKLDRILVLDIGGTHVKVLGPGRSERIVIDSGPTMTPAHMVAQVKQLTAGKQYDRVSIGYPGPIVHGRPLAEPANLGKGWVGFNFHKAFGRPLKLVNDAAMQALGSYKGRRMLFLGLGTGLGSAMIVDGTLEPMELAHLPYRHGKTYEDYLGVRGLERLGKRKWRKHVFEVASRLKAALVADYVVLGGGNAKLLNDVPADMRLGDNGKAFLGGRRLWLAPKMRSGSHARIS